MAPLDLGAFTQEVAATYEDLVRGHIVCGDLVLAVRHVLYMVVHSYWIRCMNVYVYIPSSPLLCTHIGCRYMNVYV